MAVIKMWYMFYTDAIYIMTQEPRFHVRKYNMLRVLPPLSWTNQKIVYLGPLRNCLRHIFPQRAFVSRPLLFPRWYFSESWTNNTGKNTQNRLIFSSGRLATFCDPDSHDIKENKRHSHKSAQFITARIVSSAMWACMQSSWISCFIMPGGTVFLPRTWRVDSPDKFVRPGTSWVDVLDYLLCGWTDTNWAWSSSYFWKQTGRRGFIKTFRHRCICWQLVDASSGKSFSKTGLEKIVK